MSFWVHKYGQAISRSKSTQIKTRFTTRFGVSAPVICAPMTLGVAGFDLAAAVAAKHALAFLGCGDVGKPILERDEYYGYLPIGHVQTKFRHASTLARGDAHLGIGVNLTQLQCDPSFLHQVLGMSPRNVWIGYGRRKHPDPEELAVYIRDVIMRGTGGSKVSSVEEALSVATAGVQGVVLHRFSEPGREGERRIPFSQKHSSDGSHDTETTHTRGRASRGTGGDGPGAREVIPALSRDAYGRALLACRKGFDSLPNSPVLIAAGGMATGRDLAWALEHGADAIAVGTRFAVSLEAALPVSAKLELLDKYTHEPVEEGVGEGGEGEAHFRDRAHNQVVDFSTVDDHLINPPWLHMLSPPWGSRARDGNGKGEEGADDSFVENRQTMTMHDSSTNPHPNPNPNTNPNQNSNSGSNSNSNPYSHPNTQGVHPNLERALREAALSAAPGDVACDPPTVAERRRLRTAGETLNEIMEEATTGAPSRWKLQF